MINQGYQPMCVVSFRIYTTLVEIVEERGKGCFQMSVTPVPENKKFEEVK